MASGPALRASHRRCRRRHERRAQKRAKSGDRREACIRRAPAQIVRPGAADVTRSRASREDGATRRRPDASRDARAESLAARRHSVSRATSSPAIAFRAQGRATPRKNRPRPLVLRLDQRSAPPSRSRRPSPRSPPRSRLEALIGVNGSLFQGTGPRASLMPKRQACRSSHDSAPAHSHLASGMSRGEFAFSPMMFASAPAALASHLRRSSETARRQDGRRPALPRSDRGRRAPGEDCLADATLDDHQRSRSIGSPELLPQVPNRIGHLDEGGPGGIGDVPAGPLQRGLETRFEPAPFVFHVQGSQMKAYAHFLPEFAQSLGALFELGLEVLGGLGDGGIFMGSAPSSGPVSECCCRAEVSQSGQPRRMASSSRPRRRRRPRIEATGAGRCRDEWRTPIAATTEKSSDVTATNR